MLEQPYNRSTLPLLSNQQGTSGMEGYSYTADIITSRSYLYRIALNDASIRRMQESAAKVLFTVFPAIGENKFAREYLQEDMSLRNGLLTITNNSVEEKKVIGTISFGHYTDMNALHLSHVGILPEHTGRKLTQTACEILVESLQPEIIYFVTIHPGMFQTGINLARFGYDVLIGENLDDDMYNFLREITGCIEGEEAKSKLNKKSVIKNYYERIPQGTIPYKNYPFFTEVLQLSGGDAVAVVLIKQGLDKKAYLENLYS